MIDPQTATDLLAEISQSLDIFTPDDEHVKFWRVQVIETIKAHRKKAALYDELVGVVRKAVNGR